jgi:hypothetical protein
MATYADVLRQEPGWSDQQANQYAVQNSLVGQQAPADWARTMAGQTPAMNGLTATPGAHSAPGRAWVVGEDGKPVPLFDAE